MSAPFSFTVRPPSSSTAPARPSPLANGSRANSSRAGPPSRRLFENGHDDDSDDDDHHGDFGRSDRYGDSRSSRPGNADRDYKNGRSSDSKYALNPNEPVYSPDTHRPSKPSEPLVIPALPNRDWRESSRRTPSFRPEAPNRETSDLGTHERIGDGAQKIGLHRFEVKREEGAGEEQQQGMENGGKVEVKQEEGVDGPNTSDTTASVTVKAEPLSLEEQAMKELLAGETRQESAEEVAQRETIIAMQANSNTRVLSEAEALQRDIHSLPEESTMEDFEAVPISAFGIAALRGMGWDPNSSTNVKAREVQRRPQLLGLGATPMEIPPEALQGKSRKEREREKEKKEKKKSRDERTGRGFSAASLLMRTPTGSGVGTPVNGSSRAGSAETGTESDASRRRRREEDEGGRDSKRRDDRDRDRDGGRDRDRDRERDRDSGRDRDGRRYETEEERNRRKAKERERYHHDADKYDRSDREKYRDRDRDNGDRNRDRRREDDRERRRDRD